MLAGAAGGVALRRGRQHCDQLGTTPAQDGHCQPRQDGRPPAEADFRRVAGLAVGPVPGGGLYPAWAGRRAGRTRPEGRLPFGMGVRPRRKVESQKKTLIASEQDRPDVARRRAQWMKYQPRIDPSRLVFIDETWNKTKMGPLWGWAPRGERLKAKVPHGHWQTMTFLAALRHDSVQAPWLIAGPMRSEPFRVYVEKLLVPTLRGGDIVVMDNPGSHKGDAVRRAIRSAGARLFFLPKYSPDLNPIEQLFAKLKHWLRKAAQRAPQAVCDAIGQTLETITSTECRNYFANAGYEPT